MLKADRNSEIVRLAKEEGKELKEIGIQFSISRERVRQILEDHNISSSQLKSERVQSTVTARIDAEGLTKLTSDKSVNRFLKKTKGVTVTELVKKEQLAKCLKLHEQKYKPSQIAKELGVHRSTVYSLLSTGGIVISVKNRKERNEEIKQLWKDKVPQTKIAEKYSITTTQVANIIADRKKPYDPNRYKSYKGRLKQLNNTKNGNS